ncbi:MAG: hypothetical protein ACTSR8_02960 [Promethearchaeota archaeon]
MAELYKNNWFGIGLLISVSLLAIISVLGYVLNPALFSSFSLVVFLVILSVAGYMLYNIKKLAEEIKDSR